MKRQLLPLVLLALLCSGLSSCWSQRHVVGAGSVQDLVSYEHGWWFCWGFFGIHKPNSASLAQDATSYEVVDEMGFWDLIISLPTGFLVTRTTTTVTR
ncbi:MAG: hypothetical protein CSA62_09790 [Planctomycetota bacterium]|nr:MAG: hypothetical protein CSA62_09790 [Planctomycetota bacterium]